MIRETCVFPDEFEVLMVEETVLKKLVTNPTKRADTSKYIPVLELSSNAALADIMTAAQDIPYCRVVTSHACLLGTRSDASMARCSSRVESPFLKQLFAAEVLVKRVC